MMTLLLVFDLIAFLIADEGEELYEWGEYKEYLKSGLPWQTSEEEYQLSTVINLREETNSPSSPTLPPGAAIPLAPLSPGCPHGEGLFVIQSTKK